MAPNKVKQNQKKLDNTPKNSPTSEKEPNVFNFEVISQSLTKLESAGDSSVATTTSGFEALTGVVRAMAGCLQEILRTMAEQTITHAEILKENKTQTSKLDALHAEVTKCKKENQELRTQNEGLRNKMNDLEQYSFNYNLVFNGIPENKNEDTYCIVTKIAECLGVNIDRDHIEYCHRLKKSEKVKEKEEQDNESPKPPSIVAKFYTRQTKDDILLGKKNKWDLTAKDLGFDQNNTVYVNEHLTATNRNLFWLARGAKRQLKYKYAWSKGGRVFLRKDENSPIIRVTQPSDIPLQ